MLNFQTFLTSRLLTTASRLSCVKPLITVTSIPLSFQARNFGTPAKTKPKPPPKPKKLSGEEKRQQAERDKRIVQERERLKKAGNL